jgi:hypothetical protein
MKISHDRVGALACVAVAFHPAPATTIAPTIVTFADGTNPVAGSGAATPPAGLLAFTAA